RQPLADGAGRRWPGGGAAHDLGQPAQQRKPRGPRRARSALMVARPTGTARAGWLACAVAVLACVPLLSACAQTPAVAFDTLGIGFVRVPAGVFRMGSDEAVDSLARDYPGLERRRFEGRGDEAPVHEVRISRPFEM